MHKALALFTLLGHACQPATRKTAAPGFLMTALFVLLRIQRVCTSLMLSRMLLTYVDHKGALSSARTPLLS